MMENPLVGARGGRGQQQQKGDERAARTKPSARFGSPGRGPDKMALQ
jgi:hypothetical protein